MLTAALDAIPALAYLCDADGTIRLANRPFRETYGDCVGQRCFAFLHGRAERCPACPAAEAARTGSPVRRRIEHSDGRVYDIQAAPVAGPDGETLVMVHAVDVTEQHGAEAALGESQRHLATLVSNLPGMVYRCRNDAQWTMLYMGGDVAALTGYATAELENNVAMPFSDLIHPDDRGAVWDAVQRALARGEPFRMAYRIRARGGQERWVWEQGRRIGTAADGVALLEGFITDITAEREARDALERTETRYRMLVERMHEGLIILDGAGRMTYANRRFCEMAGRPMEEVLRMDVRTMVHPEDRRLVEEQLEQRRRGRRGVYEARMLGPDGSVCWAIVSGEPLTDAEGRYLGSFAVVTDITERKRSEDALREARAELEARVRRRTAELSAVNEALRQEILHREMAEEALRDSEARYRGVVEDQTELICRWAPDGALTFVNAALCRCFGRSYRELLGAGWPSLLRPEDTRQLLDWLAAASPERPVAVFEQPAVRGDGRAIWLEWTNRALFDERGRLMEVQAVGRDVTARREAQEALQRANDELELRVRRRTEELAASEANYRAIFNASVDAIFVHDLETGAVLDVNEKAYAMYGVDPSEGFESQAGDNSMAEQGFTNAQATRLVRLAALEGPQVFEWLARHRDGHSFWTEVHLRRAMIGGVDRVLAFVRDIGDRRAAQDALRASEERHRGLFEESPVALWEEDFSGLRQYLEDLRAAGVADFEAYFADRPQAVLDGIRHVRVRNVNRAALRLYGAAGADELLGGLERVAGDEAFEAHRRKLTALAAGQTRIENEMVNRTLDGRLIEVVVTASIPPGYEQTWEKVLVSVVDVTARKQAERALRESEANYRSLFEDSPISLWEEDLAAVKAVAETVRTIAGDAPEAYLDAHPDLVDRAFASVRVTNVNRATLRLYAAGPEQFRGGLGQVVTEETRPCLREILLAAVRGRTRVEAETVNRTLDGRRLDVALTLCVVPGHEADWSKVLVSILDISARKQAERDLRAQRDFAEQLVETAQAVVVVLDVEGRILRVNRFGQQLGGYTEAELRGRDGVEAIVHADDRAGHRAALARLITEGHFVQQEGRALTRDGQERLMRWYGSLLRGTGGEPMGLLIIGHDTTELRRQQDQLRQAQKMEAVGHLAGGIAHDFNNILTVILGNAQLLKMGLPPGGEEAAVADQVIQASRRAAELTRQLLSFARRGKMQVVAVNVHDLIDEAVGLLSRSIDRRIEIRQRLQAASATLMGDPGQLQSALLNLGLNARDAMPMGGEMTFSTRAVELSEAESRLRGCAAGAGSYLEVSVRDTGVGIDPEARRHLFEPFFTTKEVGRGTGLGLAGVYGCVKNHAGAVEVDSEPGAGATFRLLLPLTRVPESAPPKAPGPAVAGTGRILLVDDEKGVRDFAARALRKLGYAVDTAADGAEAVEFYRDHWREIDLVILDLVMPRQDGRDTLRQMRQIHPEVRALFSSGFSVDEVTQRTGDAPPAGFLAKPYRIDQLSQVVAECLGRGS